MPVTCVGPGLGCIWRKIRPNGQPRAQIFPREDLRVGQSLDALTDEEVQAPRYAAPGVERVAESDHLTFEGVGQVKLKGFDEPVRLCRAASPR